MSSHVVNVDRSIPLLLPPDLHDWVPENDMVHFVLEATSERLLRAVSRSETLASSPMGFAAPCPAHELRRPNTGWARLSPTGC